jgi:DNA-binding XRE family transcriptional regulator
MIPVITGSSLTERLEKLGLSPEAFAKEAGVSNQTIRNHESGRARTPNRQTRLKIHNTLNRLERLREQMEATKDTPQW